MEPTAAAAGPRLLPLPQPGPLPRAPLVGRGHVPAAAPDVVAVGDAAAGPPQGAQLSHGGPDPDCGAGGHHSAAVQAGKSG